MRTTCHLVNAAMTVMLTCSALATGGHCTLPPAPAAEPRGMKVEMQQMPVPRDLNRTDACATARTVLQAFRAVDLRELAHLSSASMRVRLEEMAGQMRQRSDSMLSDWRHEVLQDWDGSVGQVRSWRRVADGANTLEAQVELFELTEGELLVVMLVWEEGRWSFEDLSARNRADFAHGSLSLGSSSLMGRSLPDPSC